MQMIRILSIGLLVSSAAHAQVAATVDLLSPDDPGYDSLPVGVAVVDYFVDIATTDVWTVAATHIRTESTATLIYARDPNDAIILRNPGLDQRYTTSLSRPRARDAAERFTNGGVAILGGWWYQWPSTTPTDLDVGWVRNPPATPSTPSEDGYVARVAIDLGDFAARRDFLQLSLTPPDPGAILLASSTYPTPGSVGWVNATFDVPPLSGINWYLFDPVPEPTSLALSAVALGVFARSLRNFSHQEKTL